MHHPQPDMYKIGSSNPRYTLYVTPQRATHYLVIDAIQFVLCVTSCSVCERMGNDQSTLVVTIAVVYAPHRPFVTGSISVLQLHQGCYAPADP